MYSSPVDLIFLSTGIYQYSHLTILAMTPEDLIFLSTVPTQESVVELYRPSAMLLALPHSQQSKRLAFAVTNSRAESI